jgi:hypothetical protein
MQSNAVIIRNGSYCCAIFQDRIDEWPATQFKAVMQQMAKGGKINDYAVEFLSEWFPEALRDAKSWWEEVQRTYKREFRSYKDTPRSEWEEQKAVNAKLNETLHVARRRFDKLNANYKHFLAAKASMKKEN